MRVIDLPAYFIYIIKNENENRNNTTATDYIHSSKFSSTN